MTQSSQPRTWFITGVSTGFGRHLAETALEAGAKVVATARKLGAEFLETVENPAYSEASEAGE